MFQELLYNILSFFINFSSFTAMKRYNTKKKTFDHLNFKELIQEGNQCIEKLQYYVLLMSNRTLTKINKKELKSLIYFIVENPMIYYFVWDELNRNIPAEPW